MGLKQVVLPKELLKEFPKGTKPEILKKGGISILKPNFTEATSGLIKNSKLSVEVLEKAYENYITERGFGK